MSDKAERQGPTIFETGETNILASIQKKSTEKSNLKYLLTCYHSIIKLISFVLKFGMYKNLITLENNLRLDFFILQEFPSTMIIEGTMPIINSL